MIHLFVLMYNEFIILFKKNIGASKYDGYSIIVTFKKVDALKTRHTLFEVTIIEISHHIYDTPYFFLKIQKYHHT